MPLRRTLECVWRQWYVSKLLMLPGFAPARARLPSGGALVRLTRPLLRRLNEKNSPRGVFRSLSCPWLSEVADNPQGYSCFNGLILYGGRIAAGGGFKLELFLRVVGL